jgi:hypothetical protein
MKLECKEKNWRSSKSKGGRTRRKSLELFWRCLPLGTGKGRPKSLAFEHQVRTILASGCSARAAVANASSSARVYLTAAALSADLLLI